MQIELKQCSRILEDQGMLLDPGGNLNSVQERDLFSLVNWHCHLCYLCKMHSNSVPMYRNIW